MKKFIGFSDWEKSKYVKNEEVEKKESETSSAQLIAELEELSVRRKKAVRDKDAYEAQILELDIRLKKLEIERSEIIRKQKDLSEARDIAKKNNTEGKSHDQE
jgi:hypothetical protein